MAAETAEKSWDSGIVSQADEKGNVTRQRFVHYTVTLTDPANDTDDDARTAPNIPADNELHPDSVSFRCNNIDVKRISPILCLVVVRYVTGSFQQGDDSPLNRPAVIDYFTISSEEPVDEDVNGEPIENVNHELYEGVTRPVSDLGIRITKNLANFDPLAFYNFNDTVNDDSFLVFPPGTVAFKGIQASERLYQQQPYYEVVGEFHVRRPYRTTDERAWWIRLRHEGFYERGLAGGNIYRGIDDDGQWLTKPAALDADGIRVPDNDPQLWLEFQVLEAVPYSGIGLLP